MNAYISEFLNKKSAIASSAIILILLAGNLYFFGQFIFYKLETQKIEKKLQTQQVNQKALAFAKLLIENILSGEKEVSFENRLKLENAVRDINDQEVFNQWTLFTESATQEEAQKNLSNLLNTIINKISY